MVLPEPTPEQAAGADLPVEQSAVRQLNPEDAARLYPSGHPNWWLAVLAGIFSHWPHDRIASLADEIPRKCAMFHQAWIGRLSRKFHGKRQKIVRRDGHQMVHDFTENLLPVIVADALRAERDVERRGAEVWKNGVWFRTFLISAMSLSLGIALGWFL